MKVALSAHNPSWKERFRDESRKLSHALGQNVIAIHHIGSTAIPGIVAKPVIDVLVEVAQINQVDENAGKMSQLRFESMGEYGIGGRRYFRRPAIDSSPACHVHVFEANTIPVIQHLVFRDYLLARPGKAEEYSKLKVKLSMGGSASKSDYQKSKAPFIEACIQEAMVSSGTSH